MTDKKPTKVKEGPAPDEAAAKVAPATKTADEVVEEVVVSAADEAAAEPSPEGTEPADQQERLRKLPGAHAPRARGSGQAPRAGAAPAAVAQLGGRWGRSARRQHVPTRYSNGAWRGSGHRCLRALAYALASARAHVLGSALASAVLPPARLSGCRPDGGWRRCRLHCGTLASATWPITRRVSMGGGCGLPS